MSTITLGAQTAAPTPARSESKGATGDTGAAGFGAALADAMAPERPAAGVSRGHGKHSAQPKTDAVKEDSATAADGAVPADDSTVDPTTVAPQTPAPTANPLALLVAASGATTGDPAIPESQSVLDVPPVPELVDGPRARASTSPANLVSATVASPIVIADAAATPEALATPVGATPATASGAPAMSAATSSAPATPAKPAAKGSAATPALASSGATTPATDGAAGSIAGPVTPVAAAATPVPAAPASVTQGAASVLAQTTPPLAAQAAAAVPGSVVAGSVRDERAPRIADASVSGAAGAVQPAPASGVQTATSASPVAAPQAPAPANAPTFAAQLAKPLFTLATSPAGDHIVTVKVTPENLGPVTVRAHIGAEGVRMELFAPNDAGREALRSILTDLRRDLASQGASANLDLSSQNQPTDSGDRGARQGASALPDRQTSSAVEPEIATVRRDYGPMSSLDVLA